MDVRHKCPQSTLFVASVSDDETIESDVKRLQAAADELFTTLVLRVHTLEGDLDQRAMRRAIVVGAAARTTGEQLVLSASLLYATLHDIRGHLERVNAYLTTSSQPPDTSCSDALMTMGPHEQE